MCHGKTCPDMEDMILLTLCYINTHTSIHIHTNVTNIGALLSLQPMIPPGCSEGLAIDVFCFFLLKPNSTNSTTQVQLQRQSVVQKEGLGVV